MDKKREFKGKGQGRIFQSALLEGLTKTSPVIALCTYIPLICFFLFTGFNKLPIHSGKAILFLTSGIFTWTFMEYLIHRYIFHFINEWRWSIRFHYIIHGVHHEYPRDQERLFMPPLAGLLFAATFFSFFWILLGKYTFYFMPGFIFGYLVYSFTHWSIHTFQPPKSLQFLWRHHIMHHYRTPDKAYGVSSVFWDIIFGSMPPKK